MTALSDYFAFTIGENVSDCCIRGVVCKSITSQTNGLIIYLCDGMKLSTILLYGTTGSIVLTRNLFGLGVLSSLYY